MTPRESPTAAPSSATALRAVADGDRHLTAGRHRDAEREFRHALDALATAPATRHAALARVRAEHGLGAVRRCQGRYADAELHLRTALEVARTQLEPGAQELVVALNQLGVTFKYSGRFAEAERLYREALQILQARAEPNPSDVASIYHNLGGLAHARGDHTAAEPLARQAVTIRERALGPDHPAVAADRAALAPILDALGRHDEAERVLQDVLRAYRAQDDQYEVGVTLNNLGAIAFRRGDPAGALAHFRGALTSKERVLGADHPELAPTLNNLAVVYEALGEPDQALPLYTRAVAILEPAVEPGHPTLRRCLARRAELARSG